MTTAAIRMGDGHVVHSCGDCEVEVPMGSRTIAHQFYLMDTEAFDFVSGTEFFVQHSQIQSLTLDGSGRESVPLEQSEHTSSYLRLSKEEPSNMMAASKTEEYQLFGEVLDQGLKELGYSREDLSVELFASDKQHVLDLYCSKGKNCSYKFACPSFGMAYGNPRFSEPGRVLTKVALERSRMVLCSPDWGAHGGNEYWRNLLDRLTISSVRLLSECLFFSIFYYPWNAIEEFPWPSIWNRRLMTSQRSSVPNSQTINAPQNFFSTYTFFPAIQSSADANCN